MWLSSLIGLPSLCVLLVVRELLRHHSTLLQSSRLWPEKTTHCCFISIYVCLNTRVFVSVRVFCTKQIYRTHCCFISPVCICVCGYWSCSLVEIIFSDLSDWGRVTLLLALNRCVLFLMHAKCYRSTWISFSANWWCFLTISHPIKIRKYSMIGCDTLMQSDFFLNHLSKALLRSRITLDGENVSYKLS